MDRIAFILPRYKTAFELDRASGIGFLLQEIGNKLQLCPNGPIPIVLDLRFALDLGDFIDTVTSEVQASSIRDRLVETETGPDFYNHAFGKAYRDSQNGAILALGRQLRDLGELVEQKLTAPYYDFFIPEIYSSHEYTNLSLIGRFVQAFDRVSRKFNNGSSALVLDLDLAIRLGNFLTNTCEDAAEYQGDSELDPDDEFEQICAAVDTLSESLLPFGARLRSLYRLKVRDEPEPIAETVKRLLEANEANDN